MLCQNKFWLVVSNKLARQPFHIWLKDSELMPKCCRFNANSLAPCITLAPILRSPMQCVASHISAVVSSDYLTTLLHTHSQPVRWEGLRGNHNELYPPHLYWRACNLTAGGVDSDHLSSRITQPGAPFITPPSTIIIIIYLEGGEEEVHQNTSDGWNERGEATCRFSQISSADGFSQGELTQFAWAFITGTTRSRLTKQR